MCVEPIRPHYSKFCAETRKMVIYVTEKKTKRCRKEFDSTSRRFSDHTCSLEECATTDAHRKTFDVGNQGLYWRRFHRDRDWMPLMCLTINWNPQETSGFFDVFCNANGEIGRYEWNEELKCYDRVQIFDVRVKAFRTDEALLKKNPSLTRKNPTVASDKDLVFFGSVHFPEIVEDVFFLYNQETMRTKQYVFNVAHRQFEKVDLPMIKLKASCLDQSKQRIFSRFGLGGSRPLMMTTRIGQPIRKTWFSAQGHIVEEAAPIRDSCHLDCEGLVIRKIEQRYIGDRENKRSQDEVGWELWTLVAGTSEEEDLVVDVKGFVTKRSEAKRSDEEKEKKKSLKRKASEDVDGEKKKKKKAKLAMEKTLVKTCHLTPIEWRSKRNFVFSAHCTATDDVHVFKYDTSENVFREIEWCEASTSERSTRQMFGGGAAVELTKKKVSEEEEVGEDDDEKDPLLVLLTKDAQNRLSVKDVVNGSSVSRTPMVVEMMIGEEDQRSEASRPKVSFAWDRLLARS